MNLVEHSGEVRGLVQQGLEMLDCFLFRQIQSELLLDLLSNISMFDVGYIGVYHQSDEVKDKIGALP